MSNRFLLSLTILLYFTFSLSAGETDLIPPDNFVNGWIKSESLRHFIGDELYGHIDGGAELFFEFGFNDLLIQRYMKGTKEVNLEIYQMENPEAALGIYIQKSGRETPIEGVNARNTGNRSQVSIVKNSLYIQINNFSFDELVITDIIQLANYVLNKTPSGKNVTLFEHLSQEDLIAGSEIIIRGKYALQPIYTFGSGDVLQLKGEVFGVVGDYKDAGEHIYTIIKIPYPIPEQCRESMSNLISNLDPYLTVLDKWDGGFIFSDYTGRYGIVEIDSNVMIIKINLTQKPEK